MNLFRIHIRPGGYHKASVSFAYCLEEKLLGVGWQTYTDEPIRSWEEYEALAGPEHDHDLSRVRYLRDCVRKDDLIWTRCADGEYYLAKVESGWEYFDNARARIADIVNVVRCDIRKVPLIDDVPGSVVNNFRPARTIQAIRDGAAMVYSRHLWNALSQSAFYPPANDGPGDVFAFLTAEQTEDLIFIYLQTRGWLVVPHSRKADTMGYEFYLIHRETRERAIVQVKTGHVWLHRDDWVQDAPTHDRTFLFQSEGNYSGDARPAVECIDPAEVLAFMRANVGLLPANIARWLQIAGR